MSRLMWAQGRFESSIVGFANLICTETKADLVGELQNAFICCRPKLAVEARRPKVSALEHLRSGSHLSSLALEASDSLLSPLGSHLELGYRQIVSIEQLGSS